MFEEIGLIWEINKCGTVDIVRGNFKASEENVQLSDSDQLKILTANDHYKFLGKYENSMELEELVCNEASKE